MSDPVNHPSHYTDGRYECLDVIEDVLGSGGYISYCRGNAIKYLWRAGKKGSAATDYRKAEFYCREAAEAEAEES